MLFRVERGGLIIVLWVSIVRWWRVSKEGDAGLIRDVDFGRRCGYDNGKIL